MTAQQLTTAQRDAKAEAIAFFRAPAAAAFAAIGASSRPASKNIIGIGLGTKIAAGSMVSGQEAVRIYVRAKSPRSALTTGQEVPREFGGLPTDVIEVPDVTALSAIQTWQRFGQHRPTSCGVSVGHPAITAGTLGCIVARDGNHYILSNNHVLANSNAAKAGDSIIQPGSADGGSSSGSDIATLEPFQPLNFTGAPNSIDAAIALIGQDSQTDVEPDIIDIGKPTTTTGSAALYQSVRKHGRTTGHTVGVIMDLSVDLWVGFGNQSAWFEDQLGIQGVGSTPFSQGGDSGSLVVDAVSLEPIGLLFAGGGGQTFANPIDAVLSHYGVSVVG